LDLQVIHLKKILPSVSICFPASLVSSRLVSSPPALLLVPRTPTPNSSSSLFLSPGLASVSNPQESTTVWTVPPPLKPPLQMGLTLQFQIYSDTLKTQEDLQTIGSSFSYNNKNAHENWEQRSQNVNQIVPNSRFLNTYKQLLLHRATTQSELPFAIKTLKKNEKKRAKVAHSTANQLQQRTKYRSSDRRIFLKRFPIFFAKTPLPLRLK
jgi:hypothetical protein